MSDNKHREGKSFPRKDSDSNPLSSSEPSRKGSGLRKRMLPLGVGGFLSEPEVAPLSAQSKAKPNRKPSIPIRMYIGLIDSIDASRSKHVGTKGKSRNKWICEAIVSFYQKSQAENPVELIGDINLYLPDDAVYPQGRRMIQLVFPSPKIVNGTMDTFGSEALGKLLDKSALVPTDKANRRKTKTDIIQAACFFYLSVQSLRSLSN